MTFKTIYLAASALMISSTLAFAQSKPSCDEIANPKAGDNCDEIAAAPNSNGFLTGAGPIALLLLLGGVATGGGGGTPTTGTSS